MIRLALSADGVLHAHAGWEVGMTSPFYVGLAAAAGHLAWQISSVDLASRADCLAKFKSNRDLGAIMFSGIVLGKLCM